MKDFRGRITRSESGIVVLDSDSDEYDEVEPYFTPGNFDIIVNNNFNILVDDDDDDISSTYEVESEDDSPLPLEDEDILDFASVEDDEEDVSMEGFFAFGGRPGDRRRTRSMDSPGGNNPDNAQAGQSGQPSGGGGGPQAQDQQLRPTSSRMVSRGSSMTPQPLSPHSLAIGDEMRNEDINTLIFDRPIPMNGFSSDSNDSDTFPALRAPFLEPPGSPRSPTIGYSFPPSINVDSEDGNEDRSVSVTPEYNRIRSPSPSYCPSSPTSPAGLSSAVSEEENVSVRFSNSSNASNSPGRVRSITPTQYEESSVEQHEAAKGTNDAGTTVAKDNDKDPCSTPASSSSHGQVQDDESESGRKEEFSGDGGDGINPMVSDVDDLDENDDALRGDRIGATTYSERHVLKILIKWVQELPKYNCGSPKDSSELDTEAGAQVDKSKFLDNDFEEEMALLWDMSFEPDVMTFLVANNIFNIIRQTLDESNCERLTEITLGIMANILSQQSIVEDFSIHDASLGLVDSVVAQAGKMANVPVLIQVFAVLRRITWFLRNVALVQKWMNLLLSQEFLTCTNFILSSCTNALLLANVLITVFTVLETLGCDTKEDEPLEKDDDGTKDASASSSCNFFGKEFAKPSKRETDFEGHRPFCETGFVNSLCEGLKELMKDPKPRKTRKLNSTRDGRYDGQNDDDATLERDLADMEVPIPDGLVQNAILNGLTSFYFFQKTPNGKEALRRSVRQVINLLLEFFRKFSVCTDSIERSSEFDYFALAVNLISFCQKELGEIVQDVLAAPITTAVKLVDSYTGDSEEEMGKILLQKKSATGEVEEHDGPTFIALVIHEYLASLADAFGPEEVYAVKGKNSKFFKLVDNLVTKVSNESVTKCNNDQEEQS